MKTLKLNLLPIIIAPLVILFVTLVLVKMIQLTQLGLIDWSK